MQKIRSSPPFVKSIKIEKEENGYLLKCKAEWPNPVWKHVKTDINFSEKENTATISYTGSIKANVIAPQVIKPFSFSVNLKFPRKGDWKVIVKGRAGNKVESLSI